MLNSAEFWASIGKIIAGGFEPEGLQQLEEYAEQFIEGRLVYQRFSSREQHGCSAGGSTNVIATLLAGAENTADCNDTTALSDYQRECQCGARQERTIEQ